MELVPLELLCDGFITKFCGFELLLVCGFGVVDFFGGRSSELPAGTLFANIDALVEAKLFEALDKVARNLLVGVLLLLALALSSRFLTSFVVAEATPPPIASGLRPSNR